MATIKINYGGTVYSMVKTSSKITTPSVKVDGGYIPCFKGDRFSEVLNGSLYYTLSPVCANGYRLACGTRTGFSGNVNLTLNFHVYTGTQQVGSSHYNLSLTVSYRNYSVSTSQSGFTATISNVNVSEPSYHTVTKSSGGPVSLTCTLNFTFSGNITVKDSSGNIVKSFSFSKPISYSYAQTVSNNSNTNKYTSQTYQIG